jgi:uncharacterized membrane protein YfcA
MFRLVVASVLSAIVATQVIARIRILYRTRRIWVPHYLGKPALGLICGSIVLGFLVRYVVTGWSDGLTAADALLHRTPTVPVVAAYWVFLITRGEASRETQLIPPFVRDTVRAQPLQALIGFVAGALTFPSYVLLAPLFLQRGTMTLVVIIALSLFSLAEVIVVLIWLVRHVTPVERGERLSSRLVQQVPALGWGWLVGYGLAFFVGFSLTPYS